MLRALLLGVLSVTAVASCKGKEGGPAVQAGVAAGKVVDVVGTVTAKRGAESRPLAVGSEVSGDDEIETGADSAVAIVLSHNNATWQLTANKHGKVAESLAWGLAKVDKPAVGSIESTSAAGRFASREAASTNATAAPTHAAPATAAGPPALDQKQADPGAAPSAQPATATKRGDLGGNGKGGGGGDGEQPKHAPRPSAVASQGGVVAPPPSGGAAPAAEIAPPPPPPPPPPATAATESRARAAAEDKPAATAPAAAASDLRVADPADELRALIQRDEARMQACVDASTPTLKVTLVVGKGVATFHVPTGTAPAVTACLAKIATGMKPSAGVSGQVDVQLK